MDDVIAYTYHHDEVNLEALDEALRARLLDNLAGICTGPGDVVRVLVKSPLVESEELEVELVVKDHDPTQLTDQQQAAYDRKQVSKALAKPWDQWADADKDALLQLLAEEAGIQTQA